MGQISQAWRQEEKISILTFANDVQGAPREPSQDVEPLPSIRVALEQVLPLLAELQAGVTCQYWSRIVGSNDRLHANLLCGRAKRGQEGPELSGRECGIHDLPLTRMALLCSQSLIYELCPTQRTFGVPRATRIPAPVSSPDTVLATTLFGKWYPDLCRMC